MAVTHSVAARNAIATAVNNSVNGGSTDPTGDFVLKEGGTTIATINLQNPAYTGPVAGVLTLAGVPLSANASASVSTAVDNFEIRDRDNAVVKSGTVTGTGGGGDVEINNPNVVSGQEVEIQSLTYTAPP